MRAMMTQTITRRQTIVTAMSLSNRWPNESFASAIVTVDTVLAVISHKTAVEMSAARPAMIRASKVWPHPYSAETCRRAAERAANIYM